MDDVKPIDCKAGTLLKALKARPGKHYNRRVWLRTSRHPLAPYYWSDRHIGEVTISWEGRNREDKISTTVQVDARVTNGHDDSVEVYTPTEGRPYNVWSHDTWYEPSSGFWGSLCDEDENLMTLLELLPSEALVSIHVGLDNLSTSNHVDARMHGDALYLCASWQHRGKEKRGKWLLASSTGLHNTARFGGAKHDPSPRPKNAAPAPYAASETEHATEEQAS